MKNYTINQTKNNMRSVIKQMIFTVLLSVFILPAFAGWVITEKSDDGSVTTIYIQDGLIAQSSIGEDDMTIINVEKGTITLVINQSKSYWEGTPIEFRDGMLAALKNMMAAMPDEQKPMMQAMITKMEEKAKNKPQLPDVKVNKLGSGPEIAGHSSTIYEVKSNGTLKEKVFLAGDFSISDEISIKDFRKMMATFGEDMSMESDLGDNYGLTNEYIDLISKGYPLKTISVSNGIETTDSEVTKVVKENIPAAKLQAPAGYTKISTTDLVNAMMGM